MSRRRRPLDLLAEAVLQEFERWTAQLLRQALPSLPPASNCAHPPRRGRPAASAASPPPSVAPAPVVELERGADGIYR